MQVRLLDMSDPSSLAELQNYNLPKGAGPHGITIAPGERLVATSNYYVSHNGQGFTAPFTGTAERSIRLFTLAQDGNSFSPHPQVPYIDCKNLFPHKGAARPHGMAFKAVAVDA
jgi:hypothetical protein